MNETLINLSDKIPVTQVALVFVIVVLLGLLLKVINANIESSKSARQDLKEVVENNTKAMVKLESTGEHTQNALDKIERLVDSIVSDSL